MRAAVHHLSRASAGPHAVISLVCVCVTRRRRGGGRRISYRLPCARYLCAFHLSEMLNITFVLFLLLQVLSAFTEFLEKSIINLTLFCYTRDVINGGYVRNLGTEIGFIRSGVYLFSDFILGCFPFSLLSVLIYC